MTFVVDCCGCCNRSATIRTIHSAWRWLLQYNVVLLLWRQQMHRWLRLYHHRCHLLHALVFGKVVFAVMFTAQLTLVDIGLDRIFQFL